MSTVKNRLAKRDRDPGYVIAPSLLFHTSLLPQEPGVVGNRLDALSARTICALVANQLGLDTGLGAADPGGLLSLFPDALPPRRYLSVFCWTAIAPVQRPSVAVDLRVRR